MADKAPFSLHGRNPDVLACIANLSNDEVFTPPDLANRMLDTLAEAWADSHGGKSIWEDSSLRFLDPCTKSGIFLREITRRLTQGLATQIPDLRQRVDHILTKQVFGIAITRLTSLMSRRTLYCSKHANGEHSIATSLTTDTGNVWFAKMEHIWSDTKCTACGAPRGLLDRDSLSESYAYPFIHTTEPLIPAKLFGPEMMFDVIIGNPPYQMSGGAGGSSDSSIYHLFVERAIKLEPKYLSMVIPSRWMAGGRGLDEFRAKMLNEGHIRSLIDFTNSEDAFPGLQIKGGVCYFLWSRDQVKACDVTRIADGEQHIQMQRELGEFDVFVRDERALGILRKILALKEPSVIELVSGDTPFGLATNFSEWRKSLSHDRIPLHLINGGKRIIGYADRSVVRKNSGLIDKWKVFVPKAYGAGEQIPHQVLGKLIVSPPPSICTQSYLVVAPFSSASEAESFASYYRTLFFRFLVSLRKITQDALRSTYLWVHQQTWDRTWTDEELNVKYGITSSEFQYIRSVIRPLHDASD